MEGFLAPRCNWEPGGHIHLHGEVRHNISRASSTLTSSVAHSPIRGLWMLLFRDSSQNLVRAAGRTAVRDLATLGAAFDLWPSLRVLELCHSHALYLLNLNCWPIGLGPRPGPTPGSYLWSLGWGWTKSLLPALPCSSYWPQWDGILPPPIAPGSLPLLSNRHVLAPFIWLKRKTHLWVKQKPHFAPKRSHIQATWRSEVSHSIAKSVSLTQYDCSCSIYTFSWFPIAVFTSSHKTSCPSENF